MVSMHRIPTTETAIIADLKNPPGNSGSNARRRSNNQEQRSPPMALPPPMFPNTNLSQFQLSKVRVPVITPSKRAGNENKHMLGSEAKNHVSTSKSASRESKKNNEDGSDAEEINPRDQNHFVESNFQLQDPSQQQHFDWNQKEKAQSQTEDQNSNPMINFESQNAVAYEDPYKILQSIENMESLDSVEEYLVDGIGNGDPNSTFRLDESVQLRTSMIDSSSPPTKDLLSHGNSMLTTVPALRISEVNVHSPEHCFLDPNVTESNAVNHSSTLTVTPASFHQSPSPKQLDWHCPNMDQFFRDSLTGSVGSFASDNESNHDEVESNRDSPERIVAFRQSHSRRSSLNCNLREEPKPSLPKQVEETSETSNKSKSGHSSSPAPPLRPISLVPRNRVQDSLQVDSIFCSSKTSGNVSRNDYDDDLLSKIRMTKPPTMSLPPCLFPNKSEGTQRVLILGGTVKSSNGCFNDASDTEMINNGTMKSTSSYHEFLMDLFPAFEGCTFLLPSLKKRKNQLRSNNSQCKIKISTFGNIKLNSRLSEAKPVGPTSGEIAIGKRRVETAICAFGGSIKRKTPPKRVQHSSIFRKKEPISASAESEEKQNSRKRKNYEEKQKQQYFENGSRLSWEVTYTFDDDDSPLKKRTSSGLTAFSSPNRRKKYRCKLCGQLKQNHTCPFEESLLRSIGVMVHPSVNPHIADEPGSLAPPLSEMNNFALVGSASFAENSPVTSAGKTIETKADIIKVSPPLPRNDSRDTIDRSTTEDAITAEKNEEVGIKSIFQPAMEIAPEQYRTVTPLREWEITSETGSYSYPAVPLTDAQRKSASDKLFGISKKLPSLTQECAEVLKGAREGNQWDLAVAELTTQVICVTHCSESKDYKLEGLRRYLLTLGIAC